MAGYQGDIHLGDTIDVKFTTTAAATGAPTTLSGSPVISAYVGNSLTQITAGITLSVDFDSVTGLNNVRVVASGGNGYATATNISLVITTGTVGGTSAVGYEVGSFSIDCRGVNQILGTAVSTPATAGILDVNVKNIDNDAASASGTVTFPNATLASTTNITAGTMTTVTTLTNLPSIPNNWLTAAGINAAAFSAAKFAADTGLVPIRSNTAAAGAATTITLDASASASNNFYNNCLILLTGGTGVGQARFITAYVGGTKVATVATWVTNPDNTTTFAILPFDAVAGASAPTVAQIVTGIMQDTTAGNYTVSGSFGKGLFTSGAVPGAAGGLFIAGTNAATTVTTSFTSTFTGNLTGSVASVTARVTANTDQLAGQTVTAAAGVTFPTSIASPTNITAGVITTVTNLTNAPTAGDFTATMKTSIGTAVAASAVASVTGNVGGNVTGSVGSVVGAVGSVTGAVGSVTGAVGSVTGSVGGSVASVVGAVGSVTAGVIVTTNNDKTGYTLSTAGMNSVSDNMLDRDMSTGTDSGSPTVRTPRQAFRALRNRNDTTTLTVYKEDDTTASWTYTLTTDAAAVPITVINPAGP